MEQTNVLHPGNSQNNVKPNAPEHHSTFNMSNRLLTTQRFGQIGVMKTFESEPADNVPLYSSHKVQSYSLSSRLMSDVYLKKDWFQVPRRALLPENYDKAYNNPPFGDDIPDDASTSVANFTKKVSDFFTTWFGVLQNTSMSLANFSASFVRFITSIQYFYSYGSLISNQGYSMERFFRFTGDSIFDASAGPLHADQLVDQFWKFLATYGSGALESFNVSIDNVLYDVYTGAKPPQVDPSLNWISLRRFAEILHDDPQSSLSFVLPSSSLEESCFSDLQTEIQASSLAITYDESPFDLAYPAAYQMVCAHFYSNDSIDAVFSADIYRQVVYGIFRDCCKYAGGTALEDNGFFSYNGVQTPYDALSARVFDYLFARATGQYFNNYAIFVLRYFSVMFAWRNSLRFGDYFTGGRTNPLSIGNVGVAVINNNVNVIDVISQTQKARFMNFANRAHRKLEGYLEDLTGEKPSHDWHNPLWLGHMDDVIYSVETENTGDAQLDSNGEGLGNSITSRFVSDGNSRYAFEVDIKEQSILIGLCYFDIPRAYSHATRRMFFQKNRYDWFNPFMQTVGDQQIYLRELTDAQLAAWDFPFAYKVKHAEYKESFDIAKGALASGKLRSWVFSDDVPTRGEQSKIDERFIRSSCTELDRFYLALTDYSLANYFHFIVCHYSEIKANRDMIVAPTLL